MLYAAIARCPVFGGTLASFDASQALKVPGVKQALQIEEWVAVLAENTWAAFQGRNALAVTWDEGRNAALGSASIRAGLTRNFPDPTLAGSGSLAAIYDIPFEAHMTMEPMNCTAHVHDEVCEVWAPTQNPQEVQGQVASATRLPRSAVTVNVPLIGGGFGRRLQADYAVEAALVSQAVGAPVKVVWSRNDDVQHDFYHALSSHYASASLDAPQSYTVRSVSSYSIPTGAWRSVDNFPEAYGHQCFIDELAFALGRDPLDLQLELAPERGRAVLRLAAEKVGAGLGPAWGGQMPAGWGRGIAYHASFGVTHVAQVAEVEVKADGSLRVHRFVCAVDCGAVVNPDAVAAQMQGGIAFGLTAALKAQATLADGRIQQSNFHDCPILRMDEMPTVEVYIVESSERPTGIGEMGVPPAAPAQANAIFAATGKRIRHIPILPEDLR
jgi:isoquinoline 1-oxidoreductase beta subunit